MMMNSEHIGRYPFTVEPFSEDYKGRLSWGFLGNHLLRCASLHAGSHGFGYDEMQETRHVWVLSRLVVELEEMPRTGDKYTVETWVSAIYRQFTDRLFAITGESGRVFGYGHSVWALIDMDSRQPMELEALPDGGFSSAVTDRKIPIKGPVRIRVKNTIPDCTLTTRYSDLDINRHVNSIRYIEMMLDLFPKSLFDSHRVKRMEVAYSAEAYFGDRLSFFKDDGEDGSYAVEVRKQDGTPVVKAVITFDKEA